MIRLGTTAEAHKIAEAAGTIFNPACDHAIVRSEEGKLLGGVIYTGYTGASIRIHVAGFVPRWCDKDMLWMAFHYPFEQLECNKLIGFVHSTNLKALDLDRKLGFKEEARIAGVYRDADLVIMTLRREDCRWLTRGKRRGISQQRRST